MADYPDSIYSPRTIQNKSGVVYDADKKQVIYAEDFELPGDEIVAIENELGINPKGSYANVAERLDSLLDLLNDSNSKPSVNPDSRLLILWDPVQGMSFDSVDWQNKYLLEGGGTSASVDWGLKQLKSANFLAIDWDFRHLDDYVGHTTVDWEDESLIDTDSYEALNWYNRTLIGRDGAIEKLNWDSSAGVIIENFDGTGGQPSNPVAGQIYFDTFDSHFYGYDGASWKQLDN